MYTIRKKGNVFNFSVNLFNICVCAVSYTHLDVYKRQRCNRRDHIINEEIRSDLDIFAVNEKIKEYTSKWIQHINRMDESRIPKIAKDYNPRGRRKVGRPKER